MRSDGALDNVGIDFDPPVAQESFESSPPGEGVADRPCEFGFPGQAGQFRFPQVEEPCHNGGGPFLAGFTSWLGLAPSNKVSGGKMLSSRTRRSGGRAAALLRLAAVTVGRTDTALGAFYRRLSARIGKAKAVTATARKIAVLFYNAVRYGMDYVDPGASSYETRYRTRVVNNLHRRAKAFGFVLQPLEPKVGAAVS